jgi:hypothetical protein
LHRKKRAAARRQDTDGGDRAGHSETNVRGETPVYPASSPDLDGIRYFSDCHERQPDVSSNSAQHLIKPVVVVIVAAGEHVGEDARLRHRSAKNTMWEMGGSSPPLTLL